ncbi:MAG: cupin domain-containing protein [Alphaproteobacteria bacterium]
MDDPRQRPILLGPGEGRGYPLGRMRAVFKADEAESAVAYSISEWWLEPGTPGPGPHTHAANDDIFYVLEGTMRFLIGERWVDAPKGTFVRAPAGTVHDFANESDAPAGFLNIYVPGGFERDMPAIVDWFARQPAG